MIYENIAYKHIDNIVESFVTRLQRCIDLEGNRAGNYLFIHSIISFLNLKYKNKTTSDNFCGLLNMTGLRWFMFIINFRL